MKITFKISRYLDRDYADISVEINGGRLEDYYSHVYSKDQWKEIVNNFGDVLYEVLHYCPEEKEKEIKEYICQTIGVDLKESQ